jgi:hypothetical protein
VIGSKEEIFGLLLASLSDDGRMTCETGKVGRTGVQKKVGRGEGRASLAS